MDVLTSELIMREEKDHVKESVAQSRMPTPKGRLWNAIKNYYSLPDPVKFDKVQSKVVLPPNWTIGVDPNDPYGRQTTILDHEAKKVGSFFLKMTFYDKYGYTSFDEQRLRDLGVYCDSDDDKTNHLV